MGSKNVVPENSKVPEMVVQMIHEALAEAIRLLEGAKAPNSVGASGAGVKSVSLDEAIKLNELIEEAEGFKAEVYEASSRPLLPKKPPSRIDLSKLRFAPIGVDSSSRQVNTSLFTLTVSSVSASSWYPVEVCDWPPLYKYLCDISDPPPFIALIPNDGVRVGGAVGDARYITVSNPVGVSYDSDYGVLQVMDEQRLILENWMLYKAIPSTIESLGGAAVLVDGPIYSIPVSMGSGAAPEYHIEAWRSLLASRLAAIKKLEELGVPVIGVVKRVERSRIISKAGELLSMFKECMPHLGDASDIIILFEALVKCHKRKPGYVISTPKVIVKPTVADAPPKIIEYLVLPHGKWQFTPHLSRIYRLEYTERTLEILRDNGLEPIHVALADSILRGSLEPTTILASDRRARMITHAFKKLLVSVIIAKGVPLTYEERLEAEREWTRVA